jgi:hypothetical protein
MIVSINPLLDCSLVQTCCSLASTAKTSTRSSLSTSLAESTTSIPENRRPHTSGPRTQHPVTSNMAGDTQETSSSEPQQLETWEVSQYEAALAHLERLQERVRQTRSSQSTPKTNCLLSLTICDQQSHQQCSHSTDGQQATHSCLPTCANLLSNRTRM